MLNLTIDGKTTTIPQENFSTFEDFFGMLMEELKKEKRALLEIKINNQLMEEGNQFEYFKEDISKINSVELITSSVNDFLEENIKGIEDHLDMLIANINKTIELYRINDEFESHKYFAAVLEGIRWFNYSLSLIAAFVSKNFSEISINGETVAEKLENISNVVDSLADSQETQDWIMLADQLEYELLPKITELRKHVSAITGI